MFNHIVNQQHLADSLKGQAERDNHADAKTRREAVQRINSFEGAQWQPQLFLEALDAAAPGAFEIDVPAEMLKYRGVPDAKSAAAAIIRVLDAYHAALYPFAPGVELFDQEGAAHYLGLTADGLYYYTSRKKVLRGQMMGNSMVFTRTQLDDFKKTLEATTKGRGRPRRPSGE